MKSAKNTKAWGGRFSERTAALMERFNASIPFDCTLALYDVEGSLAHAQMLAKIGVLTARELVKIERGLKTIAREIADGRYVFDIADEDIHMSVERRLTALIGPLGGKLHTARSRNDQVALDVKLYCRAFLKRWSQKTAELIATLTDLAAHHSKTILPGYTHLQRAQPILLAHHLLAYAWMSARDLSRIQSMEPRLTISPLGAGALAGTTLPIDRHFVAQHLGFNGVTPNSLDTVSDRDFVLEILSTASIQMMHFSRLCEELVLWSSQEFGFVTLPQGFCTGSSMMPQKVNPDAPELIRGKTGRVYGNLMALLTTMKGLPLAYNKDMQEDKEPLFDTVDTLDICLDVLLAMLPDIQFNTDKMQAATAEGFVLATDVADYLVQKGLPFRDAHAVVGALVQYCLSHRTVLEKLSLDELRRHSPLFKGDIADVLSAESSVSKRKSAGGTAPEEVKKQITALRKIVNGNRLF